MRLWKEICKKAISINAPSLIYQETDFGVRSLRDYLTPEIDEILVDDQETFRKMRSYIKAVAPRHLKNDQTLQRKNSPFWQFSIGEQIRVIYQERVEIKSGGYIINQSDGSNDTIDVTPAVVPTKKTLRKPPSKQTLKPAKKLPDNCVYGT